MQLTELKHAKTFDIEISKIESDKTSYYKDLAILKEDTKHRWTDKDAKHYLRVYSMLRHGILLDQWMHEKMHRINCTSGVQLLDKGIGVWAHTRDNKKIFLIELSKVHLMGPHFTQDLWQKAVGNSATKESYADFIGNFEDRLLKAGRYDYLKNWNAVQSSDHRHDAHDMVVEIFELPEYEVPLSLIIYPRGCFK